jgi:hypothetical protein
MIVAANWPPYTPEELPCMGQELFVEAVNADQIASNSPPGRLMTQNTGIADIWFS